MSGSIRKYEAEEVLTNALVKFGVPKSCYSFKSGELHVLVGSRVVTVPAKAGLTYYAMKNAEAEIEGIARDREAALRNRQQIDLEEAIASASP